ncbi:hypothetical protein BDZ94DRAFT_1309700 [Collybia nuda]|uniref:Vacuolar sorting protein Vps3844 C-terminal domain-containing protein n=1 Tax=Collybia nuda TaxID=64659 RepID=A0A9P5Y783_9AGAR|nr:hypothetical protein BDZ94DRAFT_1309700 [Collybia nuda]
MLGAWSLVLFLSSLQLSQAINVYLNTQNDFLESTLSPEDASSVLSRHLGVEVFEPFRDASGMEYTGEAFIGQGPVNGLLLVVEDRDAQAILANTITPSFKMIEPSSSLSSVISTYLHRAQHTYTSIYNSRQLENVPSLSTFFETAESPAFAAIEAKSLSDLRREYGDASEEYLRAVAQLRVFLENVYDQNRSLHVALLSYTPSLHAYDKRQLQVSQSPIPSGSAPPQEPIGGVSTCFTSADACTIGTSSCSGRGKCVAASKSGRTCFICTCEVTKTGEGSKVKTDTWVGQSCERKDVSGPFVLLTGTVIVMILLVFGSISLLSSVGDHDLPSTLLATAVNPKKD